MKARIVITENLNPYHNLALEEYLLHNVGEDEIIMFLWRNEKTVVIGRNQNIWSEVNLDALASIGGYPTRRHSGGGAVYHDVGNLNFTFVTKKSDSDIPRQTEVILRAVRSLGIEAEKNGRNDLCTIDGRKFSGHSYYYDGENCFHNGTVLIKTDGETMSRVLNPSKVKLESKGVKSVRSRTVNLTDIDDSINVDVIKSALCREFQNEYGKADYMTEPSDSELEKTISRFSSEEWIFNKVIPHSETIHKHYDWGNAEIILARDTDGNLTGCQVFTDAIDGGEAENLRKEILENK